MHIIYKFQDAKSITEPRLNLCSFSWAQTRQDAAILPGSDMVFFVLNVVEAIGVLLTFKPFLVERQCTK